MKKMMMVVMALVSYGVAQTPPATENNLVEQRSTADNGEEALYRSGTSQLDQGNFSAAEKSFASVAAMKGKKADAALYWRAYALNKGGNRQTANAAISQLRREYPKSNWLNDAAALEVEMRQASGQPVDPDRQQDEDLKLLALNSLMNSDPERAVPLLQGVLNSKQSFKVRERALFVLAQSETPKAEEIVISVAKGQSHPDLQRRAIQYIATSDTKGRDAVLAEIYKASSDERVKREVLQSYVVCDCKAPLMTAARGESDPELRRQAVNSLGAIGARDELRQLFSSVQSADDRKHIIQSLAVAGDDGFLSEIARSKGDTDSRVEAIRALGIAD